MGLKCDQSPTRFCARPIYHFTESAETAPSLTYCIWQMMPKDKEDGKRRWAPHDYGPNLVGAPVTRGFDPRAEGRANTHGETHIHVLGRCSGLSYHEKASGHSYENESLFKMMKRFL